MTKKGGRALGYASVLASALLLSSGFAWAQSPATPPQPNTETVPPSPLGLEALRVPPQPPPVSRSYHMHNGFYARASIGLGSLGASYHDDHPSGEDLSGTGFSLGGDVMIGGSPSVGLALGGALLAHGAAGVDFDRGRRTPSEDRSLSLFVLGPFVDGFPMPNKGWHVGGMAGLALAKIEGSREDSLGRTLGVGGSIWFGHDFWVADEWSLGPLLRLTGALTRDGDADANASTLSLMVLFSVLRH